MVMMLMIIVIIMFFVMPLERPRIGIETILAESKPSWPRRDHDGRESRLQEPLSRLLKPQVIETIIAV